ncbi:unnamed protein product [Dicrocoelium dendriticum]|nr:unnamed protein product [Dicrocoelium dendriticum]
MKYSCTVVRGSYFSNFGWSDHVCNPLPPDQQDGQQFDDTLCSVAQLCKCCEHFNSPQQLSQPTAVSFQ